MLQMLSFYDFKESITHLVCVAVKVKCISGGYGTNQIRAIGPTELYSCHIHLVLLSVAQYFSTCSVKL